MNSSTAICFCFTRSSVPTSEVTSAMIVPMKNAKVDEPEQRRAAGERGKGGQGTYIKVLLGE